MEKNKLMMIVIIILLVVLLGTIVGISFYVMNTVKNSEPDPTVTPPVQTDVGWGDLTTFSVGEIKRNLLKEGNTSRYIQATFSFEINTTTKDGEDLLALLGEKDHVVRDIIISVLGNVTYTELNEVNGTERLKEQILTAVRETFHSSLIWSINIADILYM